MWKVGFFISVAIGFIVPAVGYYLYFPDENLIEVLDEVDGLSGRPDFHCTEVHQSILYCNQVIDNSVHHCYFSDNGVSCFEGFLDNHN